MSDNRRNNPNSRVQIFGEICSKFTRKKDRVVVENKRKQAGLRKGGEGWMENGVEILLVDGSSSMDSGIVLGCFENEPSN